MGRESVLVLLCITPFIFAEAPIPSLLQDPGHNISSLHPSFQTMMNTSGPQHVEDVRTLPDAEVVPEVHVHGKTIIVVIVSLLSLSI